MRKRIAYLLRVYLWTVLVFIIAKVGFMLYNHVGHIFTIADVWQVVAHGLSLDLSMALYILIVPFLITIASIWWRNAKIIRAILYTYFIIISCAFALAFVADSSLYPFWGFKLDASCLQYLSTPDEAMASVSAGYLLLRLLVWIVIALIIFSGYSYALKKQIQCICLPNSVNLVGKLSEFAFYILMIPVIIIGIRGGIDESTTNIGQVYYSQDQFFNHSAVNPVFSFLASFEKTASNNVSYHFMDDKDCDEIISRLYNTESINSDTLLNTATPNIIIILMESCGGEFTELTGRSDVTPRLNRLAGEGIYFTNCYANSWRTDRGTVCTYSGYPSFPTMSVMKMPAKTRTLPCIARSLSEARQYKTHYLYGGDINFTNMRGYLIGGGFEQLTWKTDYSANEQESAKWGVRDDITFGTLYDLATSLPSPYLIGYSTLSSHEPWDVPIRKFDDETLNAFYYLDQCIGTFIDKLKKTDEWNNTLVILLPDHGINYKEYDEMHPERNHIPMIWVGGAIKAPRRIDTICNQTDLPATLLGQLGLPHTDYTFSRDVLSQTYTQPLAVHTYNNGFSLVDSTGFTVFDLNSERVIKGNGNINLGKAILQAASKDLSSR
ncbi:MAG: sulfatase-like hydrolase/transferase [Prevotella sp.]|nr:sulfatase-like hydrolase/transferase [Prevotella sp.]MBR1557017.1 sulfatase-like hydrolase/transferase [Prevotella sp.]